MKRARQRIQNGSLREVPRANNKTAWEFRFTNPTTGHKDSMYLSTEEYPTRSAALERLDFFVRQLNSGHPVTSLGPKTFGDLLDLFIKSERLLEIKKLRPGQSNMSKEDLQPTVSSHCSILRRLLLTSACTTKRLRRKPGSV